VQSAGVVTTHTEKAVPAAIGRQHAPWIGCGQTVEEQAATFPFHVPLCEAQSACERIAHVTPLDVGDRKQHAPVGGGLQMVLGVAEPHVLPLPW
jgi:hypothetical protein